LVRASCIRLNRLLAWPAVRIILAVVFERVLFLQLCIHGPNVSRSVLARILLMIMNCVAD